MFLRQVCYICGFVTALECPVRHKAEVKVGIGNRPLGCGCAMGHRCNVFPEGPSQRGCFYNVSDISTLHIKLFHGFLSFPLSKVKNNVWAPSSKKWQDPVLLQKQWSKSLAISAISHWNFAQTTSIHYTFSDANTMPLMHIIHEHQDSSKMCGM